VLAARVVGSALVVWWGLFWFGLIDLLVVVDQDERFHEHYLLESGWGLLFLVLVTVPVAVFVVRPGDTVAAAQLWVCSVAVLLGGLWGTALPQVLNGLALVATVVVLTSLVPAGPYRWPSPSVPVAVLAAVALPVALVYGWPLANSDDPGDITNGVSHMAMQASLALAVVGVTALAAFSRSRLPAWTTGFTACWLGVESVVYPDLVGSLGVVGGVLATAWGLLVVAATETARRRRRGDAAVRAGGVPAGH
jgi:hypothetical protein